jgi:predicted DNA-binding transcriptional regulator AlpA
MTWWSVLVEAKGPAGASGAEDDEVLGDFIDVLTPLHPSVGASPSSWTARVLVEAPDPVTAATAATEAVCGAAVAVGLPDWPLSRVEAVDEDVLAIELEEPSLPELLGATEAAALLGVSRQRLHQLRADGRFPSPLLELASGPIWMRAAVEAFLESWDRRSGRKPAVV